MVVINDTLQNKKDALFLECVIWGNVSWIYSTMEWNISVVLFNRTWFNQNIYF